MDRYFIFFKTRGATKRIVEKNGVTYSCDSRKRPIVGIKGKDTHDAIDKATEYLKRRGHGGIECVLVVTESMLGGNVESRDLHLLFPKK